MARGYANSGGLYICTACKRHLKLVKGSCDLNVRDSDGHAALHKATLSGQLDSVRVLVINGADLNLYDGGGNTALHVSARALIGLHVYK